MHLLLNENGVMTRLLSEENEVLIGSLPTVPKVNRLFEYLKCGWMAQDFGIYCEKMVQDFYASYAATLRGSIGKRARTAEQAPLLSTLVWGSRVNISKATFF